MVGGWGRAGVVIGTAVSSSLPGFNLHWYLTEDVHSSFPHVLYYMEFPYNKTGKEDPKI